MNKDYELGIFNTKLNMILDLLDDLNDASIITEQEFDRLRGLQDDLAFLKTKINKRIKVKELPLDVIEEATKLALDRGWAKK